MQRVLSALALTVLFMGIVGCGNSYGTVPIKGRVTFNGANPPKPGRLNFGPLAAAKDSDVKQRPGYAAFDANGNFTVTSYTPGDGLVPGTYQITVLCIERDPPAIPGGLESVSYVAPDYKGQTVTIEPGSKPLELNIDVPLKKP